MASSIPPKPAETARNLLNTVQFDKEKFEDSYRKKYLTEDRFALVRGASRIYLFFATGGVFGLLENWLQASCADAGVDGVETTKQRKWTEKYTTARSELINALANLQKHQGSSTSAEIDANQEANQFFKTKLHAFYNAYRGRVDALHNGRNSAKDQASKLREGHFQAAALADIESYLGKAYTNGAKFITKEATKEIEKEWILAHEAAAKEQFERFIYSEVTVEKIVEGKNLSFIGNFIDRFSRKFGKTQYYMNLTGDKESSRDQVFAMQIFGALTTLNPTLQQNLQERLEGLNDPERVGNILGDKIDAELERLAEKSSRTNPANHEKRIAQIRRDLERIENDLTQTTEKAQKLKEARDKDIPVITERVRGLETDTTEPVSDKEILPATEKLVKITKQYRKASAHLKNLELQKKALNEELATLEMEQARHTGGQKVPAQDENEVIEKVKQREIERQTQLINLLLVRPEDDRLSGEGFWQLGVNFINVVFPPLAPIRVVEDLDGEREGDERLEHKARVEDRGPPGLEEVEEEEEEEVLEDRGHAGGVSPLAGPVLKSSDGASNSIGVGGSFSGGVSTHPHIRNILPSPASNGMYPTLSSGPALSSSSSTLSSSSLASVSSSSSSTTITRESPVLSIPISIVDSGLGVDPHNS